MSHLAPRLPPPPSSSAASASLSRPPLRRFPSISRSSTLKRTNSRSSKAEGPPSKLRRGVTLSRRPSRKKSRSSSTARREGEQGAEDSLEGAADEEDLMDLVESLECQEELQCWRQAVGRELRSANEKLLEYTEKEYGRRIVNPGALVDELVREGAVAEPSRFLELLGERGFAEEQLKKVSESAPVYEGIFKLLVEEGRLTADSLSLFRTLPLNSLKLEITLPPNRTDAQATVDALLLTFAAPNSFCSLTRLDLSSIPIPQQALQFLSNLALLKLNLNATESTIEGAACLIPLAPTLRALHLADNSAINDDCLPLLSLFSSLESLDLTNTSTTKAGLRSFVVKAREAQPKLLQVAPPAAVQADVTSLVVPAPVFDSKITDPSQVFELSGAGLMNNYKGWGVKGWVKTQKERQAKLEAFLRSREDDIRCKEVMGEEKAGLARAWKE